MNVVEQKNTKRRREKWENELWSYLSSGDGVSCPLGAICTARNRDKSHCFNDEVEKNKIKSIHSFIDSDEVDYPVFQKLGFDAGCLQKGRVFELVSRLARKYQPEKNIVPIPDNLILSDSNEIPIEVRYVPLKAYHGAVWRMDDCWVIQLNSNDSYARSRFTLYHEIFHVLAHCRCVPVFKKRSDQDINFNEALADHFSANILLPPFMLKKYWEKIKNIHRMADIFKVPLSVMYIALYSNKLLQNLD